MILDEQAQRLEAALESLSPAHREVILLRKFEELSFAEIAATARQERRRLPHAAGARDDGADAEMAEIPR